MRLILLTGILTALTCMAALGCYSGLVVIPTADMIGPGDYGIELQYDGTFASERAGVRVLNTQFGLGGGLEAGVDFDVSPEADGRALGNVKYLLPAVRRRCACAVGICNIGRSASCPYGLLTHYGGPMTGHLGVMRIDGYHCWFVGADHSTDDRLTLMADYSSGRAGCSSVGMNYQQTDKLGVLAGILVPNDRIEDVGFSVHLVFSGT